MVDEFSQAQVPGQGGRQEQAGIGHQAMVIKEDADTVGFVLWQHLLGAPCFRAGFCSKTIIPDSEEHPLASSGAVPKVVLRWIRAKSETNATHCGECFQCIDRRIGAYGAQAEKHDHSGLYANGIIGKTISNAESKTTVVDYLRQAGNFANWNVDYFYRQTLDDLQYLNGWVPNCDDEMVLVGEVWSLCSRHGNQVGQALRSGTTCSD